MRIWILVLALAGCGKPTTCASAIFGAVDRMVADAKGHMTPAAAANILRIEDDLKSVLTRACVEDKWESDVIACIDKAKNQHDLDVCDHQLTKAQRDSEHKRMDEVMKLAVQPLPKPDGSAAP
jgi:hypothetical protein